LDHNGHEPSEIGRLDALFTKTICVALREEMQAFNGLAGLRGLMRNNPSTTYNGMKTFTFNVTYADGVSESWIGIQVGGAPSLVIEGNVPGMLPGDGEVRGCPSTFGG
jgi:hypothetical protein